MSDRSVSDKLDTIHQTFKQESWRLRSHVRDMERGIEHTTKQVDTIVSKLTFFKDERGGQVSVHHPDGTVKTEEFTDAELTALTESMRRQKTEVAARYPDMMRSMALIYLVAVFEGFLSDTPAEVLVARPEVLKSSQKRLTYETILETEARGESLVPTIVARELGEVFYKSFGDQAEYVAERFGVEFETVQPKSVERISEIEARRNVFVHNAGIVNDRYVAVVASPTLAVGERASVTPDYLEEALRDVQAFASSLHAAFSEKFAPVPESGDGPDQEP